MKTIVKCLNCGITWVRIIAYGDLELTEDLQYNCPACGSNWCEGKSNETPTNSSPYCLTGNL